MAGQIFISYRRDDSGYAAGRLFDRLSQRFGRDRLFMDIDTIGLGVDFAHSIDEAIAGCDVVLAVIGRDWLTAADAQGRRRLDDPQDFVRQELVAALSRDIPVIPVFVNGASMPPKAGLPEALAALVLRNGLSIRHERFDADANDLIQGLEKILRRRAEGTAVATGEDGHDTAGAAAALRPGERVVQAWRDGIARRFWTRVHRAELLLTDQRLVFSDLDDPGYSFDVEREALRDAVFRYGAVLREATIRTRVAGTHRIGVRDEALFSALTAEIRRQLGHG